MCVAWQAPRSIPEVELTTPPEGFTFSIEKMKDGEKYEALALPDDGLFQKGQYIAKV